MRIEDFEILSTENLLGRGGFSEVYKARYKIDNKFYALKKIDLTQLGEPDIENLKTEIKIHSSILHPNIIQYVDYFQVKNNFYIVLEFVPNGMLLFLISGLRGLPENLSIYFFYQIVKAIDYLHRYGIAHRDIKPENILIGENFELKLCDFGWATLVDDQILKKSICGTYEYMPPEVIEVDGHNSKIDIWQLGILLYEMLHGKTPFYARNFEDIKNAMEKQPIRINKNLKEQTKDLLKFLLVKNQSKRPTCQQILQHSSFEIYKEFQGKNLDQNLLQILRANYLQNEKQDYNFIKPEFIQKFEQEDRVEKAHKRSQSQNIQKTINNCYIFNNSRQKQQKNFFNYDFSIVKNKKEKIIQILKVNRATAKKSFSKQSLLPVNQLNQTLDYIKQENLTQNQEQSFVPISQNKQVSQSFYRKQILPQEQQDPVNKEIQIKKQQNLQLPLSGGQTNYTKVVQRRIIRVIREDDQNTPNQYLRSVSTDILQQRNSQTSTIKQVQYSPQGFTQFLYKVQLSFLIDLNLFQQNGKN